MQRTETRPEDAADLIRKATDAIWDRRGLTGAARAFYDPAVVRRSPMGLVEGEAAVLREVMATAQEFPDRRVLTEDVICAATPEGTLCSQRFRSRATHAGSGTFGAPSGRRIGWLSLADRQVTAGRITAEWVVNDTGAMLRQMDLTPRDWVAAILAEGAPEPTLSDLTDPAPERPEGNDLAPGRQLAEVLDRLMGSDFAAVEQCYDPGCALEYPGGVAGHGPEDAERFWLPLRAAFPEARFAVHHVAGREDRQMPPRASLRWSLTGRHDGWGPFGAPTGAAVHILGITHAEFGPLGLRREWTLIDEAAVWVQILSAAT